ncbi:MAG: hypothetical protein JJP05_04895 [cyanobacterium endosymbiont of Rhopalodia gibba]|jgi:hypothetical protein
MTAIKPELMIHGSVSFLTNKGSLESVRQLLHSIFSAVYQLFNNIRKYDR